MHNLAGTFVDWARRNSHAPAENSKVIPGEWVPKPLYTGAGLIPPRNMVKHHSAQDLDEFAPCQRSRIRLNYANLISQWDTLHQRRGLAPVYMYVWLKVVPTRMFANRKHGCLAFDLTVVVAQSDCSLRNHIKLANTVIMFEHSLHTSTSEVECKWGAPAEQLCYGKWCLQPETVNYLRTIILY